MASAKEYENYVAQFDGIAFKVDTLEEARSGLTTCRGYQKKLRLAKKEVNLQIKMLRSHYRELGANAGRKNHLVFGALFGRKASGSLRADSKRAIASQRDSAVRPYEVVKLEIDRLMLELDQVKVRLQDAIRTSDAE